MGVYNPGLGATAAQGAKADRAVQFKPSRAAAVTAIAAGDYDDAPDGLVVEFDGVRVRKTAGSTAISDMSGWTWAGHPDPRHFPGAYPNQDIDSGPALQLFLDAVKASWDVDLGAFDYAFDLGGKDYLTTQSLNATLVRQPGMKFCGGAIRGACAGKIVLDLAGTNTPVFGDDFWIVGDEDTPPRVGVYIGRALISGAYAPAARVKGGLLRTRGAFEWAALFNFASEVSSGHDWIITNTSRNTLAPAAVFVDNMQAVVDRFGEALLSDFATLPTGAGRESNICHNWGQASFLREPSFNLSVTAVSATNPVVVTVATGTLAAANLTNGDKVYWSSGTADNLPALAHRVFTVANLNTGSDTFDLLGEDGTAFGAYGGGATIQNASGPALFVAGVKSLDWKAAYALTYGAPAIVVDCNNGSTIRDWDISFQAERHPATIIEFLADTTTVQSSIYINLPNHSQTNADSIVKITGAGRVRIDGGKITVGAMQSAPANGVIHPAAQFEPYNFEVEVALAAALNGPATFFGYRNYTETAYNRGVVATKFYGSRTFLGGTQRFEGTILELYNEGGADLQLITDAISAYGFRLRRLAGADGAMQLSQAGAGALQIRAEGTGLIQLVTNATARWQVLSTGHFQPAVDNAVNLGASAARPALTYLRRLNLLLPASVTPAANGELELQATSNTTLTFKLKGSDGVVRSVALTLA